MAKRTIKEYRTRSILHLALLMGCGVVERHLEMATATKNPKCLTKQFVLKCAMNGALKNVSTSSSYTNDVFNFNVETALLYIGPLLHCYYDTLLLNTLPWWWWWSNGQPSTPKIYVWSLQFYVNCSKRTITNKIGAGCAH